MARRAQTTAQGSSRQGNPGPARRKARFSTGALVAIAVVFSLVLLVGLSVQAVAAHASCSSSPLLLNVAVNDDLAPAVAQVAQNFNKQQHTAGGRCVTVQVTEQSSDAVAARLDGQDRTPGQAAVQAWIPDSSLWVDVARSYPKGAQAIQPTGTEVAESPLMTVMARTVANQTGAFASPAGWNVLLPPSAGGPPAKLGLKVAIPDPTESAAGLATLVQLSRLLGSGATARATFTNFVLSAESTKQFASPTSLASFVSTAAAPWDSRDVTVTSEQAVIAYDRANPAQTLAAQYPTGLQSKLGTATLDYPFVLTTSDSAQQDAAREFEQSLKQPYAAKVIRYAGFRTANGVADATPASFRLKTQVLQEAAAASASEAQTNLEVWGKLELGSNLLVMIDTSRSMGLPDGAGQTLEVETGQTSKLGLSLFPDTTRIGLWEMADNLAGSRPYRPLVPIGPLPAELGLITRRQQLQQIDDGLRAGNQPLQLNNAILAGYKATIAAYQPHFSNALIVLTAGVDDGPGDMSTAALQAQVQKLFNPQRPVQILIDQIGTAGNRFQDLQAVAKITGGAAYEVHRPAEIGQVFIESFSHRLCTPSCAATP